MTWAQRAASAERAVTVRHLRAVCGVPGTVLGRIGWPPTVRERYFLHWGYWWQAHLLDCLVDAQLRAPSSERSRTIERFTGSVRLRNLGWRNDYYDDMAWLGLAMQRVAEVTGQDTAAARATLLGRLRAAWTGDAGGGIWWRRGDAFKNAPANGTAAIMHARAGETGRARQLVGWLDATLVDAGTGLVFDGIRADSGKLEKAVYTYCQGVFIGACLEVGREDAAARTVRAVAAHLAPGGVLRGGGTGDGGLFHGILARYLALAAQRLSGAEADTARRLVLGSARACWANASEAAGGPLFGVDWTRPAPSPGALHGSGARELSVQLSGWLVLEAAALLGGT